MADILTGSEGLAKSLTDREQEILTCLVEGLSNREIAERLHLAHRTVKWYNSQIYSKLGVSSRQAAIQTATALGLLAAAADDAPIPEARHNLPRQTSGFIGRRQELNDLGRLLAAQEVALVTILAPGGIGKTRLGLAAAERQLRQFADGVFFVPLAPLSSPDDIITTIAGNVGFAFYGSDPPKQQLLDYFRDQHMLLVLDNFEHLLAGANLVSDILQAAPAIKVLATSREKLNLSGETVFTLSGLNYPNWETPEDALEHDAVKLFMQNARQARPGFALQADDLTHLAHICRLTAGMPLALVLAAGWMDVLTPEQIATEIQRGIDILETEQRDVSERQQSIRASFDYSWNRLAEHDRNVFMKLSVFRGGFTMEAAISIVEADVRTLRRLTGKSLLQALPGGRYEVHELLRQYGSSHLNVSGAEDSVREAHSNYYLTFVAAREVDLKGMRQKAGLQEIHVDFENIRQALHWAVSRHKTREIEAVLDCLWLYFESEAWAQEGVQVFGKSVDVLKVAGPTQQQLYAKVLARQGALYYNLHMIARSKSLLLQSIELLRQFEARTDLAFALQRLFFVIGQDGYARGIPHLKESLVLYQELGDGWGEGQALYLLCYAYLEKGVPDKDSEEMEHAWQNAQACLTVNQRLDNPNGIGIAFRCLGHVQYVLGEHHQAQDYYQKSLDIFLDTDIHDGILYAMWGLGASACALGKYADARRHVHSSLQHAFENQLIGVGLFAETHLCIMGDIWLGEGDTERAYELYSLVDHECRKIGFAPSQIYMTTLFRLDESLPHYLTTAVRHGQTLDLEATVREIIYELSQYEKIMPLPVDQHFIEALNERELAILRLIAQGYSNDKIADELILSVGTVKWYNHHIYTKLDVSNRTEAVTRARELNLLS